ncbi:hypothetical protein ACFWD7_58320 [Streptomyces mirabilis]|uniref:hypothetical protein n=1 Tax=Streptomyces mirabilis TaxID=68239 RepID=UPI0036CBCCD8
MADAVALAVVRLGLQPLASDGWGCLMVPLARVGGAVRGWGGVWCLRSICACRAGGGAGGAEAAAQVPRSRAALRARNAARGGGGAWAARPPGAETLLGEVIDVAVFLSAALFGEVRIRAGDRFVHALADAGFGRIVDSAA